MSGMPPPPRGPVTLGALLEASCAQFAERSAVLQGDRTWSYAELDVWSTTVAHRLRVLGIRTGNTGRHLPAEFSPMGRHGVSGGAPRRGDPTTHQHTLAPDELRTLLLGAQPGAVILCEKFLTNPCADRLEAALPEPFPDLDPMVPPVEERVIAVIFTDPMSSPEDPIPVKLYRDTALALHQQSDKRFRQAAGRTQSSMGRSG